MHGGQQCRNVDFEDRLVRRGLVKNMKIRRDGKRVKGLTGIWMALMLALLLAYTALAAAGTNNSKGSIKINQAVIGQEYHAYQILTLESYDTDQDAYTYQAANDLWKTWLSEKDQQQYVSIDSQGYVTWTGKTDAATVSAFAKAALAAAKAKNIDPVQKITAKSTAIEFTGLNLGYYLVDTTTGTLCSLDTTAPDVTMYEKNEQPTVDKQVKEDSTGEWVDQNTAQIGDEVEFKTTIAAKKGASNYVLHDTMTEGLTLLPGTIQVAEQSTSTPEELTEGQDYTIKLAAQYEGTARTETTDGCAFEIVFTQTYLDGISGNKDILVTYRAILNEKAVVAADPDASGQEKDSAANINTTKLEYGAGGYTEEASTKTFTFYFDLVKTDNKNVLLDGAEFALYDAKTGGSLIAVAADEAGEDGFYHVATAAEQEADGFVSAVIRAKDGKAVIRGLDADTTYWLEETRQPNGYNKLAERVEVVMKEQNLIAKIELVQNKNTWQAGGVHVVNQAGTELPETGGMGTTLLYLAGSALVLLAAALLLVKRMHRS